MMNNDATGMKWKWLGLPALVLAAMVMALLMAPGGLRAEGSNAVANGDFEGGTTGWTCKSCTLSAGSPAEAGAAGQFTTTSRSARAQLFQTGITLQPNTTYELSFWARSSDGKNVRVTLAQQVAPRTNYGLKNVSFDLTTTGQVFTHTFTTTGIRSAGQQCPTAAPGRQRPWRAVQHRQYQPDGDGCTAPAGRRSLR